MVAHYQDLSSRVGLGPVDLAAVEGVAQAALARFGSVQQSERFDADGPVGDIGVLDRYHREIDRRVIAQAESQGIRMDGALQVAARFDAQTTPGGGGLPQDFEAVRAKILEEPMQPLSAEALFPIDRSVPFGARTHRRRRRVGEGRAAILRPGMSASKVPIVSSGVKDERFGTVTLVCGVKTGFFEDAAKDFAGLSSTIADVRRARRAIAERRNEIYWHGLPEANLDGVLNHRSMARRTFAVDLVDGPAPEAIARQLNDAASYPHVVSGTTFSPDTLAISPAANAYLGSRTHSGVGSSDLSILKYFRMTQAEMGGINKIVVAPELAGIGPNGEDGFLYYRRSLEAVGLVELMPTSFLPVWRDSPWSTLTVLYATIGGAVMDDAGHNLLALAKVKRP